MFEKLIFIVVFMFFSGISADEKLKPRLGEPPVKSVPYLFVDEKTPSYLLKSAADKQINFALFLQSSDAAWIRKNLAVISKGSLIVFVKPEMSELEKKYLDELAKISEYKITIVCFSGNCDKSENWKHPLVKSRYKIEWKNDKKGNEIFMKSSGVSSKGLKYSATDNKDFITNPDVYGALVFKEQSFAFVSLEEKGSEKVIKDAWIVVYYSKSEKKIKEFIEKKI